MTLIDRSRMKIAFFAVVVALTASVPARAANDAMVPLPQSLEVELALSALPVGLRDGATVLVLNPRAGYEVFRKGSNGFVTLVGRTSTRFYSADWPYEYPSDQLIPLSFDDVGVAVHLQPWLDLARMRATGVPATEAKRRLRAAFADGTYKAPVKGGMSYMLAPVHRAYLAPEHSGELGTFSFPHYMPYAPHVSAGQLGGPVDPMSGAPVVLTHGGRDAGPHGYLALKLPDPQVAAIRTEYAALLEELCRLHEAWCLRIDRN